MIGGVDEQVWGAMSCSIGLLGGDVEVFKDLYY